MLFLGDLDARKVLYPLRRLPRGIAQHDRERVRHVEEVDVLDRPSRVMEFDGVANLQFNLELSPFALKGGSSLEPPVHEPHELLEWIDRHEASHNEASGQSLIDLANRNLLAGHGKECDDGRDPESTSRLECTEGLQPEGDRRMAHLVKLDRTCLLCPKRGSVELFNSRNASLGVYCATCGKRRLAEIERSERTGANS